MPTMKKPEQTPAVKDLAGLFEKVSLGSAGVCLVTILAITEVSAPLDEPLQLSVLFAFLAIPLFVSIYLAKDEILGLVGDTTKRARAAFHIFFTINYAALLLLVASLAMLASHFSPRLGLAFFFLSGSSVALPAFLRRLAK